MNHFPIFLTLQKDGLPATNFDGRYHLCGNGEMLQWLDECGIAACIRVKENPPATTDLYGIDQFPYVPQENCLFDGEALS